MVRGVGGREGVGWIGFMDDCLAADQVNVTADFRLLLCMSMTSQAGELLHQALST